MSTPRKKKPAKFAESFVHANEPGFVGFDDGHVSYGSRVRAKKQPDGVFIDSAHFKNGNFHLSPRHARLLGQTLIRWADELEGKK